MRPTNNKHHQMSSNRTSLGMFQYKLQLCDGILPNCSFRQGKTTKRQALDISANFFLAPIQHSTCARLWDNVLWLPIACAPETVFARSMRLMKSVDPWRLAKTSRLVATKRATNSSVCNPPHPVGACGVARPCSSKRARPPVLFVSCRRRWGVARQD